MVGHRESALSGKSAAHTADRVQVQVALSIHRLVAFDARQRSRDLKEIFIAAFSRTLLLDR